MNDWFGLGYGDARMGLDVESIAEDIQVSVNKACADEYRKGAGI